MDSPQKSHDSFVDSSAKKERQQRQRLDHHKNIVYKNIQKNESRLSSIREANRTAKENRTYRMEDYLEVIYELVLQKGYATTIDISEYLNVSSPSVTSMVKKLHETQFLKYERYRGMSLTDKGNEVAKAISRRHQILAELFKMIGVQDEIANKDAEGIEHHLHTETLKKLEDFIKARKMEQNRI
jgi:DtxR family transcriptional regulator, manganese transport regulator